MTRIMPQEMEVWYLLPTLRKCLAEVYKGEYKMKQKEVAAVESMQLQSKKVHGFGEISHFHGRDFTDCLCV